MVALLHNANFVADGATHELVAVLYVHRVADLNYIMHVAISEGILLLEEALKWALLSRDSRRMNSQVLVRALLSLTSLLLLGTRRFSAIWVYFGCARAASRVRS